MEKMDLEKKKMEMEKMETKKMEMERMDDEKPMKQKEKEKDIISNRNRSTSNNNYSKSTLNPPLDSIVRQQKASGCWNNEVLAIMGWNVNAINDTLPSVSLEVWITALIICYLEKKFANEKNRWNLVAKKGLKYIKQNGGSDATVDDAKSVVDTL